MSGRAGESDDGSAPVRDARSALVAFGLACALAWVLAARLGWVAQDSRAETATRVAPGASAEAAPMRFGLRAAEQGAPEERFHRGVFLLRGTNRNWFGTFVGGDAFTGRVFSPEFRVERDRVEIPIAGYPALAGNALTLEIRGEDGWRSISYAGPNPGEVAGVWRVDVPGAAGRTARLVLSDGVTTRTGWLGVRAPLGVVREVWWLEDVPRNYGWAAGAAAAIVALLFLPGLAWRTWGPRRFPADAAWVPLPGLGLLVAGGLVVWLGGPGAGRAAGLGVLAGGALLALTLGATWWRRGGPLRRNEIVELAVAGCVALAAGAFAVLPQSVEQEYHAQTTHHGRMIASPPDHEIPYRTAAYFFHGKDGRADRVAYFGDDWAVTSRGPLMPLAVLGVFAAFDARPSDPPGDSLVRWPASPDAFYLARIVGILLNALVVLGGAALAAAICPAAARLALVWLAVAPVVAINVDFLWPKLLATCFALLALADVIRGRGLLRAGVCLALAYLSHPVGGLFAPAIGLFLVHRRWADAGLPAAGRALAIVGVAAAMTAVPWLAYKAHVAFGDVFLRYPLGHGNGLAPAPSVAEWLACRWSNLWLTLTPGGFFLSPHMRYWLEGEVTPAARWAIGYAKTLPGGVGLAAFPLLLIALGRRAGPAPVGFRRYLIFGAFGLMLIFWGYSRDGLGRNCLEPLTVLAIVFAAVATARREGAVRWLVGVVALEALSVRALGVAADAGAAAGWSAEVWTLTGIAVIAALAPLCLLRRTNDEVASADIPAVGAGRAIGVTPPRCG